VRGWGGGVGALRGGGLVRRVCRDRGVQMAEVAFLASNGRKAGLSVEVKPDRLGSGGFLHLRGSFVQFWPSVAWSVKEGLRSVTDWTRNPQASFKQLRTRNPSASCPMPSCLSPRDSHSVGLSFLLCSSLHSGPMHHWVSSLSHLP